MSAWHQDIGQETRYTRDAQESCSHHHHKKEEAPHDLSICQRRFRSIAVSRDGGVCRSGAAVHRSCADRDADDSSPGNTRTGRDLDCHSDCRTDGHIYRYPVANKHPDAVSAPNAHGDANRNRHPPARSCACTAFGGPADRG